MTLTFDYLKILLIHEILHTWRHLDQSKNIFLFTEPNKRHFRQTALDLFPSVNLFPGFTLRRNILKVSW